LELIRDDDINLAGIVATFRTVKSAPVTVIDVENNAQTMSSAFPVATILPFPDPSSLSLLNPKL